MELSLTKSHLRKTWRMKKSQPGKSREGAVFQVEGTQPAKPRKWKRGCNNYQSRRKRLRRWGGVRRVKDTGFYFKDNEVPLKGFNKPGVRWPDLLLFKILCSLQLCGERFGGRHKSKRGGFCRDAGSCWRRWGWREASRFGCAEEVRTPANFSVRLPHARHNLKGFTGYKLVSLSQVFDSSHLPGNSTERLSAWHGVDVHVRSLSLVTTETTHPPKKT